MDELAAQLAFDPPAMGKEVHDAKKCDGNSEGKEGREVGIHMVSFSEKPSLAHRSDCIKRYFQYAFKLSAKMAMRS